MAEATIEYKNSPNESTAYAVSEGQKTKVQLVATPAGDLELADNPNVDTGYLVINGEKHKCALVAEVAGELKLPTSATDDTGYVTAQDGRQHKVKLVANLTGGGGATINNQNIDVTENGVYTADAGYTGLGTVNVNVPTGGGEPATKFGVSIDDLLGDVDESGLLIGSTAPFVFNGAGIKKITASSRLSYKFANSYCESVNLDDLEEVTGTSTMQNTFFNSTIKTVKLKNLRIIDGSSTCAGVFTGNDVEAADLRSLVSISGSAAAAQLFQNNNIKKINLDSLSKTEKTQCCHSMLRNNPLLEKIFLPMLTQSHTDAFGAASSTYAFGSCPGLLEIHFRKDSQTLIESITGYSAKFGATNATIYFDLIGTITVNGVAYARSETNSIYDVDTKIYVAWSDGAGNIIYTDATAEPAVGTAVYSDQGTTQVGTVEGVA